VLRVKRASEAVDITVCRRFKLRGMSWFRSGMTHLLRLRLLGPSADLGPLLARPGRSRKCHTERPGGVGPVRAAGAGERMGDWLSEGLT
jgi:hypothetical protein